MKAIDIYKEYFLLYNYTYILAQNLIQQFSFLSFLLPEVIVCTDQSKNSNLQVYPSI